jgi:hypothetical protein
LLVVLSSREDFSMFFQRRIWNKSFTHLLARHLLKWINAGMSREWLFDIKNM